MKTNLWAKVFFGFIACVMAVNASQEDGKTLQNGWIWEKNNFYCNPSTQTRITQEEALQLGKQKVLELFPNHTAAELSVLHEYINGRDGFKDNGMFSSIKEAINHKKTMENNIAATHTKVSQPVQPQGVSQTLQPQEMPAQPKDFQPQEMPAQPQDFQPQRVQPKIKLFGDAIKDKNHHDVLTRQTLPNGTGYTEVPTQLLYDMFETIGFNTSYVKGSTDLHDLKKRLIDNYYLQDIRTVLSLVQNAGYTANDSGCEAVFKVRNILEDTVKTYQTISGKDLNPLQVDDTLKAMNQEVTAQDSAEPQDGSTPQGPNQIQDEELQVKTAIDASKLREKLLKKLNRKERVQWNKIMANTAKEYGVKEKSVSDAYRVLMNPKSKDSTIAKIGDKAVHVLIKSQVLFSLSNPVKVILRTVVKKTPAGEKEAKKLFNRLVEKIDVVKNGVDYGVEIDENTIYAVMSSMFGLTETKTDKEIKKGIASIVKYDELNKNIKVDHMGTFADNFVTEMKEAADGYSQDQDLKGSKQSQLRCFTNILDTMETASAA